MSKMTIEELNKIIIKNFTDEKGVIQIPGLIFHANVNASNARVYGSVDQSDLRVSCDFNQNDLEVFGDFNQNGLEVYGDFNQDGW